MLFLTCEKCQTQYKLPPESLGKSGREVRCSRCKHQWFQKPAGAAPEKAGPKEEDFASMLKTIAEVRGGREPDILPDVLKPKTSSSAAAAKPVKPPKAPKPPKIKKPSEPLTFRQEVEKAVLIFALMLFISFGVIIPARAGIQSVWPASARLFDLIGFHVPVVGEGLRINGLKARYEEEDAKVVLVVEGTVTNAAEHAMAYPTFFLTLKSGGEVIHEWDMGRAAGQHISSGSTKPFKFVFPEVSAAGTSLVLTFKEEDKDHKEVQVQGQTPQKEEAHGK